MSSLESARNKSTTSASGRGMKNPARLALGLAAAAAVLTPAVVIYCRVLGLGFFSDDFWFVEVIHTRGPFAIFRTFAFFMNKAFFRPMASLAWVIDHSTGGLSGEAYHLTNILLHALNAALLCCWIIQLTGKRSAGILGGLLFLYHPVQAEAVFWASGRFDVLCLTFMLASLVFYTADIKSRAILRLLGLSAFGLLALLTKETAAALIGTALVTELVFKPGRAQRGGIHQGEAGPSRMRGSLRRLAFLAAAFLLYAFLRININGSLLAEGTVAGAGPLEIIERLAVSLAHLLAPAWPMDGSPRMWSRLIMVLIILAGAIISIFRPPRPALLVTGFSLLVFSLAPALAFPFSWSEWTGTRVLYIPCAGLCLVLSLLFDFSGSSRQWVNRSAAAACTALLVIFCIQLGLNLKTFTAARDIIRTTLETVVPKGAPPSGGTSVFLMNFPRSKDGVMLFFNDNALGSALDIEAGGPLPKEARLKGYHSGRVGPLEERLIYPAAPDLFEGRARLYRWLEDERGLRDLTEDMKAAQASKKALIEELVQPLQAIELVSDGKLIGLFPGPGLAPGKDRGSFVAGTADAFFESGELSLNPLLVHSIEITMALAPLSAQGSGVFGQLFWRDAAGSGFQEEYSVIFEVIPDGGMHTYELPLGSHPGFYLDDKVSRFRLDPMDASGEIRLERFSIIPAAGESAR